MFSLFSQKLKFMKFQKIIFLCLIFGCTNARIASSNNTQSVDLPGKEVLYACLIVVDVKVNLVPNQLTQFNFLQNSCNEPRHENNF